MRSSVNIGLAKLSQYHERMLQVFLRRPAWLIQGYKALGHADLPPPGPSFEPIQIGDISIEKRVAFEYAAAVFTVSAIESFLLILHFNSAAIWYAWKGALPPKLGRWVGKSGRLEKGELSERLKTLSFADLSRAEEWFEDIYGKKALSLAMGNADQYEALKIRCNSWAEIRNNIVHRGGENKRGNFAYATMADVEELGKSFSEFGVKFSQWTSRWWLDQANTHLRLRGVIEAQSQGMPGE